jgi:hypothetical protein
MLIFFIQFSCLFFAQTWLRAHAYFHAYFLANSHLVHAYKRHAYKKKTCRRFLIECLGWKEFRHKSISKTTIFKQPPIISLKFCCPLLKTRKKAPIFFQTISSPYFCFWKSTNKKNKKNNFASGTPYYNPILGRGGGVIYPPYSRIPNNIF